MLKKKNYILKKLMKAEYFAKTEMRKTKQSIN